MSVRPEGHRQLAVHVATAARDVDWWLTFSSAAAAGHPRAGRVRRRQLWVDGLSRIGARPISAARDQLGPVGRRRA